MFQFSICLRHCSSRENADVHIKRVKRFLPEKGHTGIMTITDKQFGMMELFYGKEEKSLPNTPHNWNYLRPLSMKIVNLRFSWI